MKKILLLTLIVVLGVTLIFSFGYNTWGHNWNDTPENQNNESSQSFDLTIKDIDNSRPLAIGEDSNGNQYVINFGFLLNKYTNIPVDIGQTIQINGQIENNFFSKDVIFAEKATINNEEYFIDYQNYDNYYGGCGYGPGYNRGYGYGHGMMNW